MKFWLKLLVVLLASFGDVGWRALCLQITCRERSSSVSLLVEASFFTAANVSMLDLFVSSNYFTAVVSILMACKSLYLLRNVNGCLLNAPSTIESPRGVCVNRVLNGEIRQIFV